MQNNARSYFRDKHFEISRLSIGHTSDLLLFKLHCKPRYHISIRARKSADFGFLTYTLNVDTACLCVWSIISHIVSRVSHVRRCSHGFVRTAVLTKPCEQRRTCDTRLTLIRAVGNKTYTTTGNTPSGEIKALITKQTKEPRGFVHLEFSNTSNQVQPRWVIMLN